MERPATEKDYYLILGAAKTASQNEIERCYKRLAMRHHPDRGGDPEEMKAINEAYAVLGNATSRHAYDSRFQPSDEPLIVVAPPLSTHPAFLPNTVPGRLMGPLFLLLAGLVFLFLVRVYFIRFMWPIFLVAALLVILGVWKVHAVMVFALTSRPLPAVVPRDRWVQELVFWLLVCIGGYGIYVFMRTI